MNPKEMAVFLAVKKAAKPISLLELMQSLGPGFTERSVRRWLRAMVDEGLLIRIGQKRATQYALSAPTTSESLSYIRQPLFERKPVGYQTEWLNAYEPGKSHYLSSVRQSELLEMGRYDTGLDMVGTHIRRVYQRLLIDLSFNSSRLEGNTYSRLETQELVLEGKIATGKLDEETTMILNHKEAIRYLVDNAEKLTVSTTEIYTLHYLLSDGLVPTQYSGKVRDHGVRVGGSTYIPGEDPHFLSHQLTLICEKAALIKNPFEQSIFLLAHVAYLQAFHDVNKRTSRLSANIPLIKNDLVPLSFNDVDKEDYLDAMLSIYELNDIGLLSELYFQSYRRSCQAYKIAVDNIGVDVIRVKYRGQRRQILRHIILKHLTGTALTDYISSATRDAVPSEDQRDFTRTVFDDLDELGPQMIAGLGISLVELEGYRQARKSEKPYR